MLLLWPTHGNELATAGSETVTSQNHCLKVCQSSVDRKSLLDKLAHALEVGSAAHKIGIIMVRTLNHAPFLWWLGCVENLAPQVDRNDLGGGIVTISLQVAPLQA